MVALNEHFTGKNNDFVGVYDVEKTPDFSASLDDVVIRVILRGQGRTFGIKTGLLSKVKPDGALIELGDVESWVSSLFPTEDTFQREGLFSLEYQGRVYFLDIANDTAMIEKHSSHPEYANYPEYAFRKLHKNWAY